MGYGAGLTGSESWKEFAAEGSIAAARACDVAEQAYSKSSAAVGGRSLEAQVIAGPVSTAKASDAADYCIAGGPASRLLAQFQNCCFAARASVHAGS